MSVCRNCKAETTRIRTTFHQDKRTGKIVAETDECPSCKPGSFDPRWLHEKAAIAPEAYPTQFRKKYLPDGRVGYFATDERRADQEAKLLQPARDEVERYNKAVEHKRRTGRKEPMTAAEIEQAVARARRMLEPEAKRREREFKEAVTAMGASDLVH